MVLMVNGKDAIGVNMFLLVGNIFLFRIEKMVEWCCFYVMLKQYYI